MVKKTQFLARNGKKIWLFSDKDFLDWPRPPPLFTETKKTVFLCLPSVTELGGDDRDDGKNDNDDRHDHDVGASLEWNQGQGDDDDNHCDGRALFLKSRLHSTIDSLMQTLQWQRRADILHVIRSCN